MSLELILEQLAILVETNPLANLIILAIGMIILIKGADTFLEGSIKIARHFGISELIISLTLISFATSLPEMGVSLIAAFMGNYSVTVSNIIGSGIVNICVIIGLPAIFIITKIDKDIIDRDCLALIATYMALVIAFVAGGTNIFIGLTFLAGYCVYLYYLYHHNKAAGVKKARHANIWKQFAVICIGIVLVYAGSRFSVDAAVNLSRIVGLSEWFIGATILAMGTSLPEISIAFQAMRKKKIMMSIGTAIGSNVFNVLVILGLVSLTTPLQVNLWENWFDLIVLLASAILLTKLMLKENKVGRRDGCILFALYLIYLIYLLFFKTGIVPIGTA
ncbi:calcium/sodium antiporter [archaeon]|nr:calcium/sodium antiporter [archaeon]